MKKKSINKLIYFLIIILFLLPSILYLINFQKPDQAVIFKVNLIKEELYLMGYDPKWIQISRKRLGFFNTFLQNSAKR
jgi:hypothetical protein